MCITSTLVAKYSPSPTSCDTTHNEIPSIKADLSVNVPGATYQTPLDSCQKRWFNLTPGCPEGAMCWHLQDFGMLE